MVRAATACVALLLTFAAAGCGANSPPPKEAVKATAGAAKSGLRGTAVLGSSVATDFSLRDQNGRVVQLSAQHGKFVLVTFLYTKCPDVCPILASNLNRALGDLTPLQRRNARVIAVSTDPIGDTRRAVQRYVAAHRLVSQFHFLIGSAAELRPVWQAYNVLVEPGTNGRVGHSAYVLLIDRSGSPLVYYSPQVRAADLVHDLRRLMSGGT